ncbi:TPA: pore-forming bacteriocin colicin Y [Escherichia coli]|uniref:Pore-forming bacteriocin colicin Y n=1 Tax=Escherichia marmotae TaxID=1499973 RepID=A0A7H9KED5_9ESCH|nr:pore-forming bacteriocin colicin Y [Escherichia marmotae]EIQ7462607.1 pore-forming bacteriocin colicin Y [Escherichia coli]EIS6467943.1 pore-forming bacteriocin colicin Y [Escherichia coli]EIY7981982.1 pore-forming bacteriocin colicin Y [Escherichia coli]EJD5943252.1 pore-forming bacteriocin colicin Y [Escherichia coli]EKH2451266.1 pore-forming bacteriocin colicin Y [Escherichia coli]
MVCFKSQRGMNMPGFNYGGYGDGTGWSSESGGPAPGGGMHGNSGGQRGDNANSSNSVSQQISAIQNDQKLKQKVVNMLIAARKMNPEAKMILGSIAPSGVMQVTIEGVTSTQAKQLGLGGLVMGYNASGVIGAVGEIDTGHRLNASGASTPGSETSVESFVNGKKPAGEWHAVAKDSWTGAGPVNAGLVNNAIKSVRIIKKGYVTGVLLPEEVMNKAEYKAMRQAFDSLPLAKQGEAVRQIVAAWSLAYQDFPVNLRKDMGRVTERVVDAVNLALILNQISSRMSASQKDVDAANRIINETVKAINDVNLKIAEKKKQQAPLLSLMKQKQKKVEELKKVFKNHSYHRIRDAQRAYDDARNKNDLLVSDINALQAQVSGLTARKQQAEKNKAAAEKAKADAKAKAEAEKAAAEAKAKAEAEKARKEAEAKANDEKAVLTKASEIIISVGDKVGEYLGDKYKALSREIAGNIKNFQGKTIRSYDEAMASVNKLMANPDLKINAADRDVIVNAWKAFDAEDMGNKFAALGKTFKAADYVMKANNIREKSIEGYQTGNWGPLMREVESWVVSGIASAVALAIFSATLGAYLLAVGASAAVVGIIGIIIASFIGALIDDKFIDRLNNEIIRPAH